MTDATIGVIATGRIAVGLVKGYELGAPLNVYPRDDEDDGVEDIHSMPMAAIAQRIARMVRELSDTHGARPAAAGVGFPGIIRNGVVEESPNLKQAKGASLAEMLRCELAGQGFDISVELCNDADAMAAGIAATKGQLEKLVRVWTLGNGIGFGRYPITDGVWEGGHMVVTLDPRETYCGCGGRGHLEGIMGNRAMRLRFLDLEPEEVFFRARQKDARCAEFETLWHRALAAATASSIHMGGPGKFFISGPNARFVQVNLLNQFLHEMVTMTPLQGSVFEVVSVNEEIAIVGAAVNASRAAGQLV